MNLAARRKFSGARRNGRRPRAAANARPSVHAHVHGGIYHRHGLDLGARRARRVGGRKSPGCGSRFTARRLGSRISLALVGAAPASPHRSAIAATCRWRRSPPRCPPATRVIPNRRTAFHRDQPADAHLRISERGQSGRGSAHARHLDYFPEDSIFYFDPDDAAASLAGENPENPQRQPLPGGCCGGRSPFTESIRGNWRRESA